MTLPWLMLLGLAGCGSGMPPRSAALDPANANAPESPPFSVSPPAAEPKVASTSEVDHGRPVADAQGPAVYTCPMHPEVTSPQPGKCPKCGMNLVPKKDGK